MAAEDMDNQGGCPSHWLQTIESKNKGNIVPSVQVAECQPPWDCFPEVLICKNKRYGVDL